MEKEGIAWSTWEYSKEELEKASARERDLPKVEVGRLYWQPSWADTKLLFPVVVKRT